MSTRTFTLAFAMLGVCASGGCGHDSPQSPARTETEAPVTLELARYPRKLTSGKTALGNLNGMIDGLTVAFEREPDSLVEGGQLIDAWLSRTQFLGTFDDFAAADEATLALLASSPEDAQAHTLRARYLSSVHRFDDASLELERAANLGDAAVLDKLTTYDLARGRRLEQALTARTAALAHARSYRTLVDVAAAEAALGMFDEADAHYREALELYRDVSPLPIAWAYFQRGVMWGEMADQPAAARAMYEEAVRILPDYVGANVHLAEREHSDGDVDQALARLERIAPLTSDPEPKSRLAQYLAESAPARAATLRGEAGARYTELLRAHPLAFLDHASEFYAAAGGDPERALQLAQRNLRERTNARAYLIALQAAQAAEKAGTWCELANAAAEAARRNRNLEALLATPAFECANER